MKKLILTVFVLMLAFSFAVQAEEEVELKYASWEEPEVEEKMVEKFMEAHPEIKVEIDDSIDWPWNETLSSAASAGELPDVFWVFELPISVQNEWLMDISSLWEEDPETDKVYEDIADTAVYKGKRFAAPSFQHPMGVFLNKTLFEENNQPLPDYDWTLDDMYEMSILLSNPAEDIYGLQGTNFHEHWPAINNHDLGWNAYDGEKFRFTSSDWTDAYSKGRELRELDVDAAELSSEELEEIFGDEEANPFVEGNVAMNIDYSWALPEISEMDEEIAFYPYPQGEDGRNTYVVNDYIGLSSETEHPEEAYELMKFMTFGEEGMEARYDIYKEQGTDLSQWPVANHEKIWEKIENEFNVDGIDEVADSLDEKTFVDLYKWVPGINNFHEYAGDEDIWTKLDEGSVKPSDLAPEMEERSGEIFDEAREKTLQNIDE
ncbi:MAG: ABC transporter substrate-binding protein [Bacillota bacterium]